MKLYTKAVFKEFQVKLKKSTLFRIKQNPDYPDNDEYNYLVTFHSPTNQFSWSAHEFKVVADTTKGEYRCECQLWEHTGTKCSLPKSIYELFHATVLYFMRSTC